MWNLKKKGGGVQMNLSTKLIYKTEIELQM